MKLPSPPWIKIEAKTAQRGQGVSITFAPSEPPETPGTYCVVRRNIKTDTPFYIGEARNLEQRLRILFRCRPSNNPHPCHKAYEVAYETFPNPEVFCVDFFALYLPTEGMRGRIEIEEELQKEYRTNKRAFYKSFKQDHE
jgi:hypothetical protein